MQAVFQSLSLHHWRNLKTAVHKSAFAQYDNATWLQTGNAESVLYFNPIMPEQRLVFMTWAPEEKGFAGLTEKELREACSTIRLGCRTRPSGTVPRSWLSLMSQNVRPGGSWEGASRKVSPSAENLFCFACRSTSLAAEVICCPSVPWSPTTQPSPVFSSITAAAFSDKYKD